MRQVGAEHRYRVAVRAQRRETDRLLTRTALSKKVLDIHRPPLPRELARKRLKAPHQPATVPDGLRGEPSSQHLGPPAVEHGIEYALVSTEEPDSRIAQEPRYEPRDTICHHISPPWNHALDA